MADSYVAWTNFPTNQDEVTNVPQTVIKTGDPISQSDLGVSDDDWQELIDTGAVRTEAYPDIPDDVAPAEYYKEHPEEDPNLSDEAQAAAAAQAQVDAMTAPPD